MEALDRYNKAHQDIIEYFECDWSWEEINDHRDDYWYINNSDLHFQNKPIENIEPWGYETTYCETIAYTDNSIFRKKDYTMILIETSTGDGKSLLVFDNKKEFKINIEAS
jgi:hypothetical protein